MTELITCIEHQSLPVVAQRQYGEFALGENHARLLEALVPALPANAFQWCHHAIKWSQYCGLIKLGDLTVEILPKIHGKETEAATCRYALVRMLRKAGILKAHKGGSASVHVQQHSLLDIFILHFCDQLKNQLVRGMLHTYKRQEQNLLVLRGRLMPAQQLRHNLAHKERLYCRYDELSPDTLVNQAIKYTLALLLPQSRSLLTRRFVTELLMMFDGISDRQVSLENLNQFTIDRASVRYEHILEFCKLVIGRMAPDVLSGSQESFSLLFDMNKLFESWVAAILKPVARQQGLALKTQGPLRCMAYREDIKRHVFQMKPDIALLGDHGTPVIIADAKWKLLNADDTKLGISQADLYQMQAYANRYSVQRLVLAYPNQRGLCSKYQLQLLGREATQLSIVTVDVSAAPADLNSSLSS